MRSENPTIEEKVDRLHEQVERLTRRVADLEKSLAAMLEMKRCHQLASGSLS